MRKRSLVALASMALLLAACEETEIYYKGHERPISQIEEIIEDEIEDENPGLDFELDIYEETEDSKTKKVSK